MCGNVEECINCVIVQKVIAPMEFSHTYLSDQGIHFAVKGVSNASLKAKMERVAYKQPEKDEHVAKCITVCHFYTNTKCIHWSR